MKSGAKNAGKENENLIFSNIFFHIKIYIYSTFIANPNSCTLFLETMKIRHWLSPWKKSQHISFGTATPFVFIVKHKFTFSSGRYATIWAFWIERRSAFLPEDCLIYCYCSVATSPIHCWHKRSCAVIAGADCRQLLPALPLILKQTLLIRFIRSMAQGFFLEVSYHLPKQKNPVKITGVLDFGNWICFLILRWGMGNIYSDGSLRKS